MLDCELEVEVLKACVGKGLNEVVRDEHLDARFQIVAVERKVDVLNNRDVVFLSLVVEGTVEASSKVCAVKVGTTLNVVIQSEVLEETCLPELNFSSLILKDLVHCLR